MTKVKTINIHGKEYVEVATRVQLFHEDNPAGEIITECLLHDPVVFKATAKTKKGIFTGHSSVSLSATKMIEKTNPYEVAETSAVGRALGMAGYGSVDSIASADEVRKSEASQPLPTPTVLIKKPMTVPIQPDQKADIMTLLGKKGKSLDDLQIALKAFKKTTYQDLTYQEAQVLIKKMESLPDKSSAPTDDVNIDDIPDDLGQTKIE